MLLVCTLTCSGWDRCTVYRHECYIGGRCNHDPRRSVYDHRKPHLLAFCSHLTLFKDYKPDLLTNWGYNEVACDKEILGGSKIYQLILAAFPDSVRFNSTYAMQPFYTSAESVTILEKLQTTNLFNFETPVDVRPPIEISLYSTLEGILKDQKTYTVQQSGYLPEYMPADTVAQDKQWGLITSSLTAGGGVQMISNFAEQITLTLLEKQRVKVGGTSKQFQIDIVKE